MDIILIHIDHAIAVKKKRALPCIKCRPGTMPALIILMNLASFCQNRKACCVNLHHPWLVTRSRSHERRLRVSVTRLRDSGSARTVGAGRGCGDCASVFSAAYSDICVSIVSRVCAIKAPQPRVEDDLATAPCAPLLSLTRLTVLTVLWDTYLRYPDCPRSQPPLATEDNLNPKCPEEGLCSAAAAQRVRGGSLASHTTTSTKSFSLARFKNGASDSMDLPSTSWRSTVVRSAYDDLIGPRHLHTVRGRGN
jgi:hypothetical protein